jgi:hypothetical protein
MAQPQRPGGFDMARMSMGSKLALGSSILLFISLFFPWEDVLRGLDPTGTFGNVNGFNGIGILVAILCIAVIVWEGMLAAGVNINMGTTSPALIGAILAAGAALFAIIQFLLSLGGIQWGGFLGLIFALALAYGAYLRFQESQAAAAPPPPPPAA